MKDPIAAMNFVKQAAMQGDSSENTYAMLQKLLEDTHKVADDPRTYFAHQDMFFKDAVKPSD